MEVITSWLSESKAKLLLVPSKEPWARFHEAFGDGPKTGHARFTIGETGVAMATGQSRAWGVPQNVSETGPW